MYVKLFSQILTSSIWLESHQTLRVWITLLVAMDEEGFAHFAAPGNLANTARVSLEEALQAVEILEGPDPNSADTGDEGRRIERVPGGWIVLNAGKYRALGNREEEKVKTRERVAKWRASKAEESPNNREEIIEALGACQCCGAPFQRPYNIYVVLDHNHVTGANRGWICQSCNKIVGFLEEGTVVRSPKAEACTEYIKRYSNLLAVTSNVPSCNSNVPKIRHTEAEAYTEREVLASNEVSTSKALVATELGLASKQADPSAGAVNRVFGYWQLISGHSKARLTAKRKRRITDRLREGYTEEELQAAIAGNKADAFHQGDNDRGTVFDDIELICRDGEHVEKFIGVQEANGNGAIIRRAIPRRESTAERRWRETAELCAALDTNEANTGLGLLSGLSPVREQ